MRLTLPQKGLAPAEVSSSQAAYARPASLTGSLLRRSAASRLTERQGTNGSASCSHLEDGFSQEALLRHLRPLSKGKAGPGEVYLVGTGPGDPGLLTLKAVQIMQTADVVLYDRLVSPEILQLVNGNATMVYVGKNRGFHTRTQQEIHELLCQFAREGAKVMRLKGGDPFIFGRGGEEMEYLQQRGIKVHTIPGITAASGISAELGIPLTHRGLATGVAFVTGHAREGGEADLEASVVETAADPRTTLVVYMGLATLPGLVSRLSTAGRSPLTPAAAVERGTTAEQRAVYAPLADLNAEVVTHELKSPTLVIVGEVVALAPGWHLARSTGSSLQDGRTYDPTHISELLSSAVVDCRSGLRA